MKLLSAVFAFLISTTVSATTIRHMSLEELAFKSDLVAHVEVSKAGGIYAEYKILSSLKGPSDGTFVIFTPPGPHGPHFPTVLVKEQFIILASQNKSLTQMNSTSSGDRNIMA